MSDIDTSPAGSDLIVRQLMQVARISALAEMASGISHELNQPLGAIATFAQAGERMLKRPEPLVDSAVECLHQIGEVALAAGEGIRRIRRLFGHGDADRIRCRIADVIEELKPVLGMIAHAFKGSLVIDITADLPEAMLDRRHIQHVVLALVQNAFEAADPRSAAPIVTVDGSADRYCVEVGVADRGPGIAGSAEAHLFHPFFTTKQQGTGLGLASSRAIIEAHEGSIGFDNVPGNGCRFWFRLPIASAAAE